MGKHRKVIFKANIYFLYSAVGLFCVTSCRNTSQPETRSAVSVEQEERILTRIVGDLDGDYENELITLYENGFLTVGAHRIKIDEYFGYSLGDGDLNLSVVDLDRGNIDLDRDQRNFVLLLYYHYNDGYDGHEVYQLFHLQRSELELVLDVTSACRNALSFPGDGSVRFSCSSFSESCNDYWENRATWVHRDPCFHGDFIDEQPEGMPACRLFAVYSGPITFLNREEMELAFEEMEMDEEMQRSSEEVVITAFEVLLAPRLQSEYRFVDHEFMRTAQNIVGWSNCNDVIGD